MFSIEATVKAAIEATVKATVDAAIKTNIVKETPISTVSDIVVPVVNIESPRRVNPRVSTSRIELPIRSFSWLPMPVHLAELCVALGTGNDKVCVLWVPRFATKCACTRNRDYEQSEDAGAPTATIGQFVFRLERAWEVTVGAVMFWWGVNILLVFGFLSFRNFAFLL